MLISFLRFLCHRERNWPCNTGYPARLISHLLPVPRPDCGSVPVLWFAPTATLGGNLISFLIILKRLVHGPHSTKRVLGVGRVVFPRSLFPSYLSQNLSSVPRKMSSHSHRLSYSPIGRLVSGWTDLVRFLTMHQLQTSSVSFKSRDQAYNLVESIEPLNYATNINEDPPVHRFRKGTILVEYDPKPDPN